MEFLVNDLNINKTKRNVGTSLNNTSLEQYVTIDFDKDRISVMAAYSSIQRNKYSEPINDILDLPHENDYFSLPDVCKLLNQYYISEDIHNGGIMELNGFVLTSLEQKNKLTDKDIRFINIFEVIEQIQNIYVFKYRNYTEFWFEVTENTIEVEDSIFQKYGAYINDNDDNIRILTFDKSELYQDEIIEYDVMLERKGW